MFEVKETIVVEGRDDETNVRNYVNANIICTHGFGIREETIEIIKKAYETTGIIIFTDPDHAGETIRERLSKLFPDAKQSFLTKSQALKGNDIGIENANGDDIIASLKSASCIENKMNPVFTTDDMYMLGLTGSEDSASKREKVGAILGIGSANASTFLKRLNYMKISKEELAKACE